MQSEKKLRHSIRNEVEIMIDCGFDTKSKVLNEWVDNEILDECYDIHNGIFSETGEAVIDVLEEVISEFFPQI